MKKGDIFENAGRRFVVRKVDDAGNVIEAQPEPEATAEDKTERERLIEAVMNDPEALEEIKRRLGILHWGPNFHRGDHGDRGDAGPQGDPGLMGYSGPKGDQGIQGIPALPPNEKRTTCQYCNRECKSGLAAHEAACKEEPTRKAALAEEAKALGIDTEGKSGMDLHAEIRAKR